MKRILGVMFLVILLSGSGCDELFGEEGNYINVAVSASIHAEVTNVNRTEPWAGVHLETQIIKDGGEREYFNGTTNENGDIPEQAQVTFKVYRHQPVDIKVWPISGVLPLFMGGEIFDPAEPNDISVYGGTRLYWSDLEDVGWGETYYWSPIVIIQLRISTFD